MIGFFSSKTFRLVTEQSAGRLAETLRSRTTERRSAGSGHLLEGTIGEREFEIRGVLAYGSSYLPRVRGSFSPRPEGTEIVMEMRPHRIVMIFLSIWYLFLLFCALIIATAAARGNPVRLFLLLVPLGLGALTKMLSSRVFDSDCRWTRDSIAAAVAPEKAGAAMGEAP